jgi:P27 family predicted phage terminase small subunit
MGKRGPAPTPTRLRLLNGESRPSRINRKEPIPRDLPPEPPDWISDEVRAVWDRTLAELTAMGLAHSADRDCLVIYCQAVVTYQEAAEIVAKAGLLLKGRDGGAVRNPAAAIMRDNAQLIRQFAQEFGLTPSARTGLEVEKGEEPGARSAARYLS